MLLLLLSTVFFCVEILGQSIDSLRSIAIDDSTPDTTRMKVYNELSVALRNQDFEQSLQVAQDGLELAEAEGDEKWAGVSYSNIGGAYYASNRFPEAEQAFLSAQEIFRGTSNMEGLSDCLGNLGTLYTSTRDMDSAIFHLQAANRLRDSLGLRQKLAVGLNNLANAYADQGNFEESYNTHQAAISLRSELEDKAGLAQSYANLISFFGQQGRLDSALHYAQQTIPLYKAIKNINGLAIVHFNCGHIYTMKGKFKEAYDNYANARDYFSQSGNTGAKLKAEMSIGQVLYNMGEYDDAIERINIAIEALEEVGDIPGLATAYTNLANVLYDKYRFNEEEHLILDSVLVLHQKSLSYHRSLKSQSGIAQGLVNVGTVLWKQENYAAAIENLEEGVALYRALGNERSMDSALISLGKCYMKLNKPAEALPYFESAKAIREANSLFSGDFYADLAQAYAGVGNYQRAYEHMVLDEQVRDSVYIQEKIAAITETEAKYQTEQQKAENQILSQQLELEQQGRRLGQTMLLGAGLVSLLLLGIALFWRKNLRLTKAYNLLLEEENAQLVFEKNELEAVNQGLQQLLDNTEISPTENIIEVKSFDRLYQVQVRDILYLQAEDNGVRFFLKEEKSIWVDMSLRAGQELLGDSRFVQIYRSTVVNVREVEWVNHSSLRMNDGQELKIGRSYKEEIRAQFRGW